MWVGLFYSLQIYSLSCPPNTLLVRAIPLFYSSDSLSFGRALPGTVCFTLTA